MSTGSPAVKKRRTVTVVDSPASQTVCHTESSSEVEASATVCQIRETRQPELPQPDWTDAQPRDFEVEMTEPELRQNDDNDEDSDRLECDYCHPCVAECILTDVTVNPRVERVGMIGGDNVTIMRIGHETFVQLPGDLRVNREPVTFVTGMRGALLMIINEIRQTMHCSHCSNLEATYVLDNPIATICADRDPCRCPCHKLLTALDLTRGSVFFGPARLNE